MVSETLAQLGDLTDTGDRALEELLNSGPSRGKASRPSALESFEDRRAPFRHDCSWCRFAREEANRRRFTAAESGRDGWIPFWVARSNLSGREAHRPTAQLRWTVPVS